MEKPLNNIERKLIQALKESSIEAFDKIYQIYSKRLFAYSIQFTKSPEEAEEIVQDVFVRLWQNRENIQQNETLQALLFIIAKNYLINAYRSKVNHPIYEEYIYHLNELSVNNTHSNLEYEEFLKILYKEINKLPLTQQKIVTLSRLKQLSIKEIAIELSLSEQTIKNQLSLGLKVLKENLKKILLTIILLFFI